MATGLIKFEIVLDGSSSTFSPGQMVAGRVIVGLDRAKTTRGLKLVFNGKGEVKWSDSLGSGSDNRIRWYTGTEEYFRSEIFALGKAGFKEKLEIQSGHHIFPFKFVFPQNIPRSFEHQDGYVRYIIEAVMPIMDGPRRIEHHTSMLVTIETPYDLSENQVAKTAIEDEEHDTFCCFPCFNKGSLSLNIYVPASGFAIGEAIEAMIAINNTSTSVRATSINVKLKQKITVHAGRRKKTNVNFVQNLEKKGPFHKNNEIMISMRVPPVPPSDFLHCNIIDIEYRLVVQVIISGCHCKIHRSYPILIGTRTASSPRSTRSAYVIPVRVQSPAIRPIELTVPTIEIESPKSNNMPFSESPRSENNDRASYRRHSPYEFTMANYEQMPGCSSDPDFQYPPASSSTVELLYPNSEQATTSSTDRPPPSYDICMNMEM